MELVINQLSKQYQEKVALDNFSLTLSSGVLGLLGPNGAGKSTLMRILATISQPTSGSVTWNGMDIVTSPETLRKDLGYLPQDFGIYPNLNTIEFLEYMATIKGLPMKSARRRIDELVEALNLREVCKRPLGGYSGGMKQRVGIAQALINDPKLLIVDEPTVGLDPEERIRFRNLLSDLSSERIIILSTHIVSDIESVSTQIAILSKGSLIANKKPEELLKTIEDKVWEWIVPSEQLPRVTQKYKVSRAIHRSDGVLVRIVSDTPPSTDAEVVSASLEDVYLYYVSNGGEGK